MSRRVYLGRDKKVAGVCSGIADYFGWDPTLVRLVWVIFTLAGGAGILGYIIAMIVMPERPHKTDDVQQQ
jgi:phage shock protein C